MMNDELVKSLRICGKWKTQVRFPGDSPECDGCQYHDAENNACKSWDADERKELIMLDAADVIEELDHEYETLVKDFNDAVELLHKRSKPRWIPVTERLPEKDGWYQVYAPWYSGGSSSGLKNINGNMYSAFKHGKWSIEVGYHKRPGCVKAWMPLPEPPKEETE